MPATSWTKCPSRPVGRAFRSGPDRRANQVFEPGMDQRQKTSHDVPGQVKLCSPASCRPARAIPVDQLQPVCLARPERKAARV